MFDFLTHLFDTSGFPARWNCGDWTPGHGWLHILSDLAVWSAYFAIPCILVFFVLRRRDVPFPTIFWLFGAFILACGTTHLMEVLMFWWPAYRLAGVVKLSTALVSWGTVVALMPTIPKALAMRTPDELEREIAARRVAEDALQRANAALETRVQKRTAELAEANASLRHEREMLRVTLASIGDAVVVTDTQGRVTFLNSVAQTLTGWKEEESRGQPLDTVFRIVNEQTHTAVENPAARALKKGAIVELANHILLIARDGTERAIEDSAAPIREKNGDVVGVVLVFRDATERRAAAAAAQRYQEILQLVHRVAKIGHWEWNSLTDENKWSPEIEALYGLPPGGFQGGYQGWAKLLHPDDLAKAEEDVRRALETGKYFTEFRVIWPDRSIHWLEARANVFTDGHDKPVRIIGVNMDVTERKQVEEALRRSERQLAGELGAMTRLHSLSARLLSATNLSAALDDVLENAIVTSEADFGNIQLYRPQVGALEIVAQRGFQQDFLDYFRLVRVDEGSACAQAMQSGERVIIEDVEHDPRYDRHRQIAAAAGYRAVQSTPLRSRTGRVLGMLSTHFRTPHRPSEREQQLLDLYARHAADLIERIQVEERLRLLWAAAAVMLSSAEPDAMLRELFANIAPHFGLDSYYNYMVNETGDAMRLVSCVGIPDETAERIKRLEFGQAISGAVALHRQPFVATHIQQSDDPKVQCVKSISVRACACNPLQVDNDLLGTLAFTSRTRDQFDEDELEILRTICQYIAVAYERLRLVRKLQDADRRKDEFLATLAHELRNPLAPICNGLELLRRADGNAGLIELARGVMGRQLDQMVRLIDDLLDMSRISQGKIQVRKEQVQVAAVVRSAVEAARPFIDRQRQELTITLPPEAIYLDADPTRLAQVIANLLDNAAKYTEPGGHIWLTVERQSDEVAISVRDTGIGIAVEHLRRIFEMFSQVTPALERSHGGLGIGLALVRGLVELHGGNVLARSSGIGRGSEFVVRLPVVDVPVQQQLKEPVDSGTRPSVRTCRILAVDDNRDAADSLAMMLRLMGHETRTAYDGLEAVESAAAFQPDVVLLDIGLPKMNGYEAARHIRQQPWGKGMALIALTGWGQEEDKRRALEAGFDRHTTKPVDVTELEKLLAHVNPSPEQ
jgi:PAS domain S-box-containing protein